MVKKETDISVSSDKFLFLIFNPWFCFKKLKKKTYKVQYKWIWALPLAQVVPVCDTQIRKKYFPACCARAHAGGEVARYSPVLKLTY